MEARKKETGIVISEEGAKKLERMAMDFLCSRGYTILDSGIAAQMLALVSKNN